MSPEDSLAQLGFTETEALAYCELLRSGPGTGYRVAQRIGKAQANTYKTLATLVQKGAIIDDGGDPRAFRAVAPEDLVQALSDRHARQIEDATAALKQIDNTVPEHRLYQLRSTEQVWYRAEKMIAEAKETIVFDVFPEIEERLAPNLARAVERGIRVCGIVYDQAEPRPGGYEVVRSRNADDVRKFWPGSELRLCVDANQQLLVLLNSDLSKLKQGLWSDSAYLSVHLHYALAAEFRLHALPIAEAPFSPHLTLSGLHPPGLRSLLSEGLETRGLPPSTPPDTE